MNGTIFTTKYKSVDVFNLDECISIVIYSNKTHKALEKHHIFIDDEGHKKCKSYTALVRYARANSKTFDEISQHNKNLATSTSCPATTKSTPCPAPAVPSDDGGGASSYDYDVSPIEITLLEASLLLDAIDQTKITPELQSLIQRLDNSLYEYALPALTSIVQRLIDEGQTAPDADDYPSWANHFNENGKMYRAYKKGKQLDGFEHPWFRSEVEFKTKNN